MARLLVSCCNADGGLMTVETETGAAERLLDGDLRGIAVTSGRVIVGEANGLIELDRSFQAIRRLDLCGADVHGLFARDGLLYVCTTGWNAVAVLDLHSLSMVGEMRIPGTEAHQGDVNHISSIWVERDLCYLSVHHWSGSVSERPGAIVALDRRGNRLLQQRCLQDVPAPHSVVLSEKDLYYFASLDQALYRNGDAVLRFRGYPRGLAMDGSRIYAGQSRFRYGPVIEAGCGLVVVERGSGETRFIPLPAEEVFEVALLEG